MRIQCTICNQSFEVLPDVLDKQLAFREASGKLMHHVNQSHMAKISGNVGERLQALLAVCGWVFFLQGFSGPSVGFEDEYTKSMEGLVDIVDKLVRNEPTGQEKITIPTGQQFQN